MWFQDLFNYDFRRTEQCIIPYATQEGEISFCAYNTGIGWRNIIEKMHMTATLTKWYEEHGRHEIFAGGKRVQIADEVRNLLTLKDEIITNEEQKDLDRMGIAKNAREEKLRARDARQKNDPAYNERMAKLYREVVLKEKQAQPENGFIPLESLAKPKAAAPVPEEVLGD
jgi:7,8-dihydro-6-hydroxymethylpterin dimethyltransferase